MEHNEAIGYKNRFVRLVLNDGSLVWGKISMVDSNVVHIISSRNCAMEIPLSQVVTIV